MVPNKEVRTMALTCNKCERAGTECICSFNQEDLIQKLDDKFNVTDGLNYFDTAFIWISLLDHRGDRCGSFHRIHRKSLEGREYNLDYYDYDVGIFFTDTVRLKNGIWSKPLINIRLG